jgi:hypothetical protein
MTQYNEAVEEWQLKKKTKALSRHCARAFKDLKIVSIGNLLPPIMALNAHYL